jgi:hypothetical protein
MLIAVNRVQEAEREAWVCTRLAPRDVGNQSLLARARRLNQTRKNVVVTSKFAPEK